MAKVYTSAVIQAPANEVWQSIRDFNGLPDWHPVVGTSRIEEGRPADQVGCIRAFELVDGARIREQLLALSDYDYSFAYSILESEMGVENYIATVKLTPVTETGHTFAEWSAEFACPADREAELVEMIGQNVFAAGFKALNERFA
jgi:hypothetical protein